MADYKALCQKSYTQKSEIGVGTCDGGVAISLSDLDGWVFLNDACGRELYKLLEMSYGPNAPWPESVGPNVVDLMKLDPRRDRTITSCPKCGHKFHIPPDLINTLCPKCGFGPYCTNPNCRVCDDQQ
jgi:hypothetical protein